MKEQQNIHKNKTTQWFVTSVFGIILLFLHFLPEMGRGDDPVFAGYFLNNAFLPFLRERYMTWTSRVILEAVVMPLTAANANIWRILNTLMILLLIWIISDLFHIGESKEKVRTQIFFFIMMWAVPLDSLCSSGWMTTTTHYLWTLVLGLVAMRPLKHMLSGEKCPLWEYVLCPICVIYAANMEQMGAILFGCFLAFGLYIFVEKRRLPAIYFVMLTCILLSLGLMLGAPGNALRGVMETERFFPAYEDFTVYEKLAMGFIESANYYLAGGHQHGSYLFPLLSGILLALFIQKKRRSGCWRSFRLWFESAIVLCPFAFYWGVARFGIFLFEKGKLRRGLDYLVLFVQNRQIPGEGNYSWGMVGIQMIGYLFILLCVALTIFFLHGNTGETHLELIILLAGFVSRVIIGFSPTIYASGDRTAVFASMAILIVALRNLQMFWNASQKKMEKVLILVYVAIIVMGNLC